MGLTRRRGSVLIMLSEFVVWTVATFRVAATDDVMGSGRGWRTAAVDVHIRAASVLVRSSSLQKHLVDAERTRT